MTQTCNDCLFCEAIEDEEYMSCQANQKLVMKYSAACDYFEDKYTNTTELPKVKIVEQNGDNIHKIIADAECECGCCNANSYSKLNDFGDEDYDAQTEVEFFADDIEQATGEVLENLVFLGDGTTPRDVLGPILGLEATISLLKRFLLEYEER